ncbi:MAG TPA: hypothetical protein VK738_05700 [Terriglobales bacterium]|jgi:hypothetical protein|nr:hypothetical protein [Terriglobales bacterium]
MKNRIRALFLLSAALCTALLLRAPMLYGDELEDHPQKSFNVHPGGTLTFASEYGAVTVKAGEAQTATIQLDRKVHAFTAEEAKKILDDLEIEASQEGDTIHYRAKFKTGWEPSDEGGGAGRSLCRDHRCLSYAGNLRQMDFTITVPRQFNLDLATYAGHMEIGDIDGKVEAQTSGGHLSIGKIGGPVYAQTAGGHIDLGGAKGNTELRTAGGSIQCGDVSGDVKANTAGGSIALGRISGKVEAQTAGGSIEIAAAGNAVQARTSGGSIRAAITGQPTSDSFFETLGGGITLYLPEAIKATLDARGNGYTSRIHSEFPITMQASSDGELKGTINGGGPAIVIRNHVGGIQIRKGSL